MSEHSLPDDDSHVEKYKEFHGKAADRDLYYMLGNFAGLIVFGVASGDAESASIADNVNYTLAWFCGVGAGIQFGRMALHLGKSMNADKLASYGPAPNWHPESEPSRITASEEHGDEDDGEPPVGV